MPGDATLGTSLLHGDCHLLEDGAQLSFPSKNMETWEAGTSGGGHSLSGRLGHWFLSEVSSWQSQVWGSLGGSSNVQNPWAVCGTKWGGWGDLFVPPEQSQQG